MTRRFCVSDARSWFAWLLRRFPHVGAKLSVLTPQLILTHRRRREGRRLGPLPEKAKAKRQQRSEETPFGWLRNEGASVDYSLHKEELVKLVGDNPWLNMAHPPDIEITEHIMELCESIVDPDSVRDRMKEIMPKGLSRESKPLWIAHHHSSWPRLYWATVSVLAEKGDEDAQRRMDEVRTGVGTRLPLYDAKINGAMVARIGIPEEGIKKANWDKTFAMMVAKEILKDTEGNRIRVYAIADWAQYGSPGTRQKNFSNPIGWFFHQIKNWPAPELPYKHVRAASLTVSKETAVSEG